MKQNYDVEKIHPNPYQTRRVVIDEDLRALADSIREHGLQEVPTARPFAERKGHVELVKGHRRLEAWKIAYPAKPMPVEVGDYTDRQMFDFNVIENMQRKDMTAIEKAKQMTSYMQTFKASQEETGKLFGYQTQGAVSNVIRLLKLPESIHPLVGVKVPERLARRILPFAVAFPKDVIKIAETIAKADDDEKENECDDHLRSLQWGKCKNLNGGSFNQKDAPKEPHPKLGALPACKVCEWAVGVYCTRTECFSFKQELRLLHDASDTAKRLGIGVAKMGETGRMIYNGESDKEDFAKAALKLKHESLRLIISPESGDHWNARSNRSRILHNESYALATTDLKALTAALPKIDPPKKLSKAEEVKRDKERQKEMNRDVRVRADKRKEVERLKDEAVKYFAGKLPSDKPILRFIMATHYENYGLYDGVKKFDKEKTIAGKKELVMRDLMDDFLHAPDEIIESGDVEFNTDEPDELKVLFSLLAVELNMRAHPSWHVEQNSNGAKKGAKKK